MTLELYVFHDPDPPSSCWLTLQRELKREPSLFVLAIMKKKGVHSVHGGMQELHNDLHAVEHRQHAAGTYIMPNATPMPRVQRFRGVRDHFYCLSGSSYHNDVRSVVGFSMWLAAELGSQQYARLPLPSPVCLPPIFCFVFAQGEEVAKGHPSLLCWFPQTVHQKQRKSWSC